MLYIAADHRGFALKEEVKRWLQAGATPIEDLGSFQYREGDDYPEFAGILGKRIAEDPDARGILLCGSGVGASAAVNKIRGVRGAIGFSIEQVRAGRHDDDMNVLVLAADFISFTLSKELVTVFLATEFAPEERYRRRIEQIREIEKNGSR
jgi:ribose 5-phosphate isomerase B